MREVCIDCVLKHLAQAEILMTESLMGYPLHRWLAVGHMAEAEAEALGSWPGLAQRIRDERKVYEMGGTIDMLQLIELAAEAKETEDGM